MKDAFRKAAPPYSPLQLCPSLEWNFSPLPSSFWGHHPQTPPLSWPSISGGKICRSEPSQPVIPYPFIELLLGARWASQVAQW